MELNRFDEREVPERSCAAWGLTGLGETKKALQLVIGFSEVWDFGFAGGGS